MPQFLCTALVSSMNNLFEEIGMWWHRATPNDFGLLAITIVVTVWFVSKYYLD